jgi:undecaprenyl-diphosphatase
MTRPLLGLVEQLVHWAGPLFRAAGYPIVFVGVFLESSALVGLIAPGEAILALGGVYAARQDLSIGWVIAIAIAAGWSGQIAGYWLGRRYGRVIVRKIPLVRRLEPTLDDAKELIHRRGGLAIVFGRFATGIGAVMPFASGTAELPFGTFLPYMLPTVAVWATAIALVGFFLGDHLEAVDRVLSGIGWVGLAIVVLLVVGIWLWRRRRRRKEDGDGGARA